MTAGKGPALKAKMKKSYTEMRTFLKSQCPIGDARRMLLLRLCYEQLLNPAESLSAGGTLMESEVESGAALHWFLPNRTFCEWIVDCVTNLDSRHAEIVQRRAGIDTAVVLHFPTCDKLPSCVFWVPALTTMITGEAGEPFSCVRIHFSAENEMDLGDVSVKLDVTNKGDGVSAISFWYAKLIVGLGMYLECFPEQIIEGIPEDAKHPNHFRKMKAHTIGVAPSIKSDRNATSPHYRSGHFRLLQSERFTKKRGQVVFVHGCFVKGQAETVIPIT